MNPMPDLRAALTEALESPRGAKALRTLVHRGDRVLLALDDPLACAALERPRSRALALEAVLGVLDARGVARSTVTLVCASGLRPRPSRADLVSLYGETAASFPAHRLLVHDSLDESALVPLGESAHGIEVELRKDAFSADL
ncbi:DUF2088 domain-containing protein, partial [bacterium]|nr:DUF2088 domain-containing protein [bacterium]